ncbi:hypothetical protein [Paraburkholderia bonniea]|uniref:hypothetical protein n=1 Tax=Paraburkholderia bonniea TaxID=2152891 RepID=UPI001291BBB4|nr:hypothetical protein [Paraburkholderia bonniea]
MSFGRGVQRSCRARAYVDVDRFNRQLHEEERTWAKAHASDFAKRYEEKTGQALTAVQAENMLLANGYRLVDAAASKGPGGDATAVAYISENGGSCSLRIRRNTTARSWEATGMVL